jgi:hypothetical protein
MSPHLCYLPQGCSNHKVRKNSRSHLRRARVEPHAVFPLRRGAPNIGAGAMRTWLSSLINTILGRVPGKTGRLDTATRWPWMRISATAASQGPGRGPASEKMDI